MKFSYKKYDPSVSRPVIPITVGYKNNKIGYEVLIDSGADVNIFDAQIANVLGIVLRSGQKHNVTGINGKPEPYYVHTISISVGGHKHKVKAGFKVLGWMQYGVVGQKGFFDLYKIIFDKQKGSIELKPK